MRKLFAALLVSLAGFAGTATAEPIPHNTFQALDTELRATTPTTAAEKTALQAAERLLAKREADLKSDIAKAKQLEKLLGKKFVDDVQINSGLDDVLTELESEVDGRRTALAQRTVAQPDGKARDAAQAKLDAAAAHLAGARASAARTAKANLLGAALQDVLRGEAYLKDDLYFYAVVNGESFFTTHELDNSTGHNAYFNADGSGDIFAIQYVSAYDAGPPYLHDIVSMAISGMPRRREYQLQDYMASHSRLDGNANAPDGMRLIVQGDSFVKFLRVDTKKHIVAGFFQFTVHVPGDTSKVDHVRFGSFRVHYR